MVDIRKIILELIQGRKKYSEIVSFSDKPGIYALFFMGVGDFPIKGFQPKDGEIIYIGKTESSQKSRDRDTHFATGKTRSSTIRKSLGALLREKLNLTPMVKSQADIDAKRVTQYMFCIDDLSEERLTEWMQNNLGLSFYEYDKEPKKIDKLETDLIEELIPVLNIDRKNMSNPWKKHISALRKECGLIAYGENAVSNKKESTVKRFSPETVKHNLTSAHKYEDIWAAIIPLIFNAVTNNQNTEVHIGKSVFERVGNRKKYSFRLEYINGNVANNIKGSAVARDLNRMLSTEKLFRETFKGKHIIIRLDTQFDLHITND
jgi:hypothetical protein